MLMLFKAVRSLIGGINENDDLTMWAAGCTVAFIVLLMVLRQYI